MTYYNIIRLLAILVWEILSFCELLFLAKLQVCTCVCVYAEVKRRQESIIYADKVGLRERRAKDEHFININ